MNDCIDISDEDFTASDPSNYLLSGLNSNHLGGTQYDGNTWTMLDDVYQDSPQFQAAIEFNH
jgi:hypothetical protein